MDRLFRVKICGMTHPEDVQAAVRGGADAIGLNFYSQSPRYLDDLAAAAVAAGCPSGVHKVGVFVNAGIDEIRRRAEQWQLDWVQLHGDESPELLADLVDLPTIRGLRCRDDSLRSAQQYLERCRQLRCEPRAVLLDAWDARMYGGTGATLDWDRLRSELPRLEGIPWILAGGLRADNVADAITQLQPDAVDVASGVELAPGRKDLAAMERFIQAANEAWQRARPHGPKN